MRKLNYRVDGDEVRIHVLEFEDSDISEVLHLIEHAEPYELCLDTETTGLNIFQPDFRIRTVQIGDATDAYVIQMKSVRDARARTVLDAAFNKGVTIHNSSFDLLAAHATGLKPLSETQNGYHDTKLMAHLIDPRSKQDGGIGFGLKDLSARYVDPSAPDTQNGLIEEFRKIKCTKDTGWAKIDINNPTYLLYAGLDVILGSRLHRRLRMMVNRGGFGRLARFEHDVQRVTNRMMLRGFLIDEGYSFTLVKRLDERREREVARAKELGLDNVNSTKQVAEALMARGWEPELFTDAGNPKVDKAVLQELAEDVTLDPEIRVLVEVITGAKRAAKWKTAYAQAMLDARDPFGRVHANINSLQARTSRMSISDPALQQLPSRGDDAWVIRRQVIAKEGHVIVSADYDQIEFRVLAALADISQMKYAIANGIDLHDYTARLVYGDDFTKFQRSICKGVGFGKVFGGGAQSLARQTGAPIDAVKRTIAEYDAVYFELPAYARALQREQRRNGGYIVNYHGRFLPLDQGREYAAVNYSVQSIARDILAQALIDLSNAGLDDYLLLPVHDEVLAEVPKDEAEDVARKIGEIMSGTFIDVPISASGEVYGKSWAEGYVYRDEHGMMRSKGSNNLIEGWVEPVAD